jgi:DNA-binding transcriptional MerR regulator
MTELTIGRLSDKAGLNVETTRHYQGRGLMPEPDKPEHGHHRYDVDAVKRLRFLLALGRLLRETRKHSTWTRVAPSIASLFVRLDHLTTGYLSTSM